MNSYQKVTVLLSSTLLPLVLLFMNAMNYRGIAIVGFTWIVGTVALMHALREANARVPHRIVRSGHQLAPRLHASSQRRGFGSRGQR
jgi:hypothetical protein